MSDSTPNLSIAPVLTSVSFILLSFFAYLVSIAQFDPARKEAVRESLAREFAAGPPISKTPAIPRVIDDLFAKKELAKAPSVHTLPKSGELAIVFSRADLFEEKSTTLRPPYQHLFGLLTAELAARSDSVELVIAVDPVQSPLTEGDEGAVAQLIALLPMFAKKGSAPAPTGSAPPSGIVISQQACKALQFECSADLPHEAFAVVLRKKGATTRL